LLRNQSDIDALDKVTKIMGNNRFSSVSTYYDILLLRSLFELDGSVHCTAFSITVSLEYRY